MDNVRNWNSYINTLIPLSQIYRSEFKLFRISDYCGQEDGALAKFLTGRLAINLSRCILYHGGESACFLIFS
jgi:hypothetical protein